MRSAILSSVIHDGHSLTTCPPLPPCPALPTRHTDYDETLDAADDEELKADVLAGNEEVVDCCGKPRTKKHSSKKIDLEGVPMIPIAGYPESLNDVVDNYKKSV